MKKYIVITGGTSGVGLGVAKDLIKDDVNLILVGRNPEKGKKIINELGDRAIFISGDLSNKEQVKIISDKIKETTDSLFALILCHGIFPNNSVENINNNFLSHYWLVNELKTILQGGSVEIVTGNPKAVNDLPICENQNNNMEMLAWEVTHKTLLMTYLSNKLLSKNINVNSFFPGDIQSNLMDYTKGLSNKIVTVVSKILFEDNNLSKTGEFFNFDGGMIKLNKKYNFQKAVNSINKYI